MNWLFDAGILRISLFTILAVCFLTILESMPTMPGVELGESERRENI